MANPRHKIFFGFPTPSGGNLTGKGGSSGGAGGGTVTWDNDVVNFSQQDVSFDAEVGNEQLTARLLGNPATWDMQTITMDTEELIFE
jgi:hypothetical protein